MKKETYDVTGMSCAACSSRVEKAVAKQPGAQQVAVNLLKNSMVVEYDESQLSSAQIIAAVEKAGYGASLHAKPGSAPAAPGVLSAMSPMKAAAPSSDQALLQLRTAG